MAKKKKLHSTVKKRVEKALERRREKAEDLSEKILEKIQEHQYGLTTYDLATLLRTTPLGIQKAIGRIKYFQEKIITKELKRNKQIAKFYFPKNKKGVTALNYFNVDVSQIKSVWKDTGVIYVDARNTIVFVYPKAKSDMDKKFFKELLPVDKKKNILSFIIPEKISYGINLDDKEHIIKIEKDHINIKFEEKIFSLPEIKSAKILILDDRDEIRIKQIKNHLSQNYTVNYFKDQEKLLGELEKKKYDFLILDWYIKEIPLKHKEIMKTFHINNPKGKAVIITGQSFDRDDVIEYTQKGITWFFDKTIDRLPYKIEDEMRAVLNYV